MSDPREERVLVTGADGFIGGHVTERLVAMGIPVRAMTIGGIQANRDADARIEHVTGDVSERADVGICNSGKIP